MILCILDTDGEGDSDILFYDEFDNFDLNVWQHEITSGGGGVGQNGICLNSISLH